MEGYLLKISEWCHLRLVLKWRELVKGLISQGPLYNAILTFSKKASSMFGLYCIF